MDKNQETKLVNDISGSLNPVMTDIHKLVNDVVILVEKVQQDVGPLNGQDKQQIATDVINGMISLPFPINLFKKMVIKLLINYTVNKLNTNGSMPQIHPADSTINQTHVFLLNERHIVIKPPESLPDPPQNNIDSHD